MTEDEAMLFTKKIRSEYAVKIEEAKSFYDNCIRSLRIREIRAGYEQLLKACDIIDNQAAENDALCDTIDEVREEAAQVKRDFKTDEELQAENTKLREALTILGETLRTEGEIHRPEPLIKPTWICFEKSYHTQMEILIKQALKGEKPVKNGHIIRKPT